MEPLLHFGFAGGDAKRRGSADEAGGSSRVLPGVTAGAGDDRSGDLGATPIFAAGHFPDAVKILLAAGTDLEARNDNGDTA
jgi:hypothetical protein